MQQTVVDESLESPVGIVGRVTVPIRVGRVGEVVLPLRRGTEAFAARSDTPIDKHARVIVVEQTSHRSVIVTPFP